MAKNQKNSHDRVKPSLNTDRIGAIIQTERKRRKLTQGELAALAGVGLNFISQIEGGKETAQIGKVLRVLSLLGFELQVFPR